MVESLASVYHETKHWQWEQSSLKHLCRKCQLWLLPTNFLQLSQTQLTVPIRHQVQIQMQAGKDPQTPGLCEVQGTSV